MEHLLSLLGFWPAVEEILIIFTPVYDVLAIVLV